MIRSLIQGYYDLKTIHKMLLLVGIMIVFMVAVGIVGLYFNSKTNDSLDIIYQYNLQPIGWINLYRNNANANKANMLAMIMDEHIDQKKAFKDNIVKRDNESNELMIKFQTAMTELNNEFALQKLKELDEKRTLFIQKREAIYPLAMANKKEQAFDAYMETLPILEERAALVREIAKNLEDRAANRNQKARQDSIYARNSIIITIVVAVLFSIGFAFFISSRIQGLLEKLVERMKKMADGDLTVEKFGYISKSDIGDLCAAFDVMLGNMYKLVSEVKTSSEKIDQSTHELRSISETSSQVAQQVAETIEQMSTGAQNQAQEVQKSAEAVAEIARNSNVIMEDVKDVDQANKESSKNVLTGQKNVEETLEKILEIKNTTEGIATQMSRLGNLGQQIGKIVDIISNIAGQTNLLALNAAIESARAGEHGKGFAVVAEEVKKLAEESAQAANQIKEMIEQIQTESENAVCATQEGVALVDEGVKAVNDVKSAFDKIFAMARESEEKTNQVLAEIQSLNLKNDNVSIAMENISSVTEESAASAEEISASMQEQNAGMEELSHSANILSQLTEKLNQHVSVFKI